ncbi:MAG: 5'-nucleotidase, lipoprotein e(P4) family [Planctomycetota bacterium]|nr:MAG: 5'-nucleotidase, lipoprotein e(P4) family [Planctomycetota bacterium]
MNTATGTRNGTDAMPSAAKKGSGSVVCVALRRLRRSLARFVLLAATPGIAGAATACAGGVARHPALFSTLWAGTAAEYRASTEQTYRSARQALDAALSDPTWTACVEQKGDAASRPPAVILDVDETVLDNAPFAARQLQAGASFGRPAFTLWVNEAQAPLVPGAAEFIRYARAKGVRVFFVTNRLAEEEEGTRKNLTRRGIPLETDRDTVLTRNERPDWTRDKSSRRRFVARDHRVLLLIGDDLNDFVPAMVPPAKRAELVRRYRDRWGTKWFLLPNPQYGSWQRALYGFQPGLSAPEKLRRMTSHLAEIAAK